ncbi:hypothetical protein [Phenylobacterium sp.]|uniref:hypothetical protein n=1 Tax=Phenylobacterium sp. TaxID=1871053 RepID=UPI002CFA9045|nr:hypothetical protein [Phenylobacterium sp.]HLZ75200.1 hypothetical protein [Phenylobacterium sp.]
MTEPGDIVPVSESPVYSSSPRSREEQADASLFQEINERRARVENAELLQHLRGL